MSSPKVRNTGNTKAKDDPLRSTGGLHPFRGPGGGLYRTPERLANYLRHRQHPRRLPRLTIDPASLRRRRRGECLLIVIEARKTVTATWSIRCRATSATGEDPCAAVLARWMECTTTNSVGGGRRWSGAVRTRRSAAVRLVGYEAVRRKTRLTTVQNVRPGPDEKAWAQPQSDDRPDHAGKGSQADSGILHPRRAQGAATDAAR
jgi:hypothetical protein